MRELKVGMFARSLAGHDSGKLYVISAIDESYIYLSDGRNRLITNPRRKKRKHIQPDYEVSEVITSRQASGETIRDEDIRKAIKTKED